MEKWWNGKGGFRDMTRARSTRSVWLAMAVLAPVVLIAACATTSGRSTRLAPTGIAPGDALTVILDEFSGEYSRSKEEEIADCISKAIGKVQPTVRLVPSEEFRRVAIHARTPSEVPKDHQQWTELAADATFRARFAPLALRYLIIVVGSTRDTRYLMPGSGVGAFAGGVRDSFYFGTIVDVRRGAEVGRVEANAWGRVVIAIIPVIPPTETEACNVLGEQVAKFLIWETPPGETAGEQPSTESAKPAVQENRPQSE